MRPTAGHRAKPADLEGRRPVACAMLVLALAGTLVFGAPAHAQLLPTTGPPIGSLDLVFGAPGGAGVAGWAIDPDSGDPVEVHVYDGARLVRIVRADAVRNDVAAYFGVSNRHGFVTSVPLGPGNHLICAYAVNVGTGSNSVLGCRPFTYTGDPVGTIDQLRVDAGVVTARGWAYDPDTPAPIDIHVYANGRLVRHTVADTRRADVHAALGVGAHHGYETVLPLQPGGHEVCIWAVGVGPGANASLGCRAVDVPVVTSVTTPPPDPSPPPPSLPPADPGPQPTGNVIGAWQLVFADEFSGTALDGAKWNTCHWWDKGGCTIASNNELEWYVPSGVSVGNGALHLTARRESVVGDGKVFDYTSGMVTSGRPDYKQSPPKFTFTHGFAEMRAQVPTGAGLWPAFWLLPDSDQYDDSKPEIDIVEVYGDSTSITRMRFHWETGNEGARWTSTELAGGWHTFGLLWTPTVLIWYVDGQPAWRYDGPHIPDEPMYLVANLAVGGGNAGSPTAATPFPSSLSIDYLRVWQ